ncbi:MAG TPA: hypothetical protein DCW60_01435, partial [Sutterella sp.]|nr:hypothetical protein [Sutterella sp.]
MPIADKKDTKKASVWRLSPFDGVAWRRRILGAIVVMSAIAGAGYYLTEGEDLIGAILADTRIEPKEKPLEITLETIPEALPAPTVKTADDPVKAVINQESKPKNDVKPQVAPKPVPPKAPNETFYFVQVLATSSASGAQKALNDLRKKGFPVYVQRVPRMSAVLWRVRLGPYDSKSHAEAAAKDLDTLKIKHANIGSDKKGAVLYTDVPKGANEGSGPVKDAMLVTGGAPVKAPQAQSSKAATKSSGKPAAKAA